jgi:hypothetical protein
MVGSRDIQGDYGSKRQSRGRDVSAGRKCDAPVEEVIQQVTVKVTR